MKLARFLQVATFGLATLIPACTPTGALLDSADGSGGAVGSGSTIGGSTGAGSGTASGTAMTIRGAIRASASGKPAAQEMQPTFMVLAQSAETQKTYTARTDGNGEFSIEVPPEEEDGLFTITILSPDSRAAGPVLFDRDGGQGYSGLELGGPVDLGTLDVPVEGGASISPGEDADLSEGRVAGDVTVRLNEAGVPVGVPSIGKGEAAVIGTPSSDPRQMLDRDRDGLIDLFDADDDGNGVVDDFDTLPIGGGPAAAAGVIVNLFMNLKLDEQRAQVYFSGDAEAIERSLKTDTVITFEVRGTTTLTKSIAAVHVLGPPAPAPAYLSGATVQHTATLWSSTDYALNPDGPNHFQAFIVPNALLNAGDNFTFEIRFEDGSRAVFTRMLNYVFRRIPRLVRIGAPGDEQPYAGSTVSFDGSQDLSLVWEPPVDETGRPITGMDYHFEFFYYDSGGAQIQGIDRAATWPTPIPGFDSSANFYAVPGSSLTLSSAGTFSTTLPQELFPDTVQTAAGPVAVAQYKVDIAAQNRGNNAALMVPLVKQ